MAKTRQKKEDQASAGKPTGDSAAAAKAKSSPKQQQQPVAATQSKDIKKSPKQQPTGSAQKKKNAVRAEATETCPLTMHKYHFAHYQPQPIEAMCLTADKRLLAVARATSNQIEIWHTETFSQLLVIPGHKNVSIRNVFWIEREGSEATSRNGVENVFYQSVLKRGKQIEKKRRLVTTSMNGLITEWSLDTGEIKAKLFSGGGAIWSAQFDRKFGYLACEDGAIRIIKVKKRRIELVKQFSKVESQCLSIELDHFRTRPTAPKKVKEVKMKGSDDDDSDSNDSSEESEESEINSQDDEEYGRVQCLYVGYQDGSIRKWNVRKGDCVLHIQKEPAKKKDDASLIWCLKIYKDQLVSGDSKGHVCLWDTRFGTLLKKFTTLQADVLALEVNSRFGCVYASGVDSRVISIQLGDEPTQTSVFRGQSHDVKSLVLLNARTLISGGVTTDMCVYKLEEGGRFPEQYGKDSKVQAMSKKVRHVPPFEFGSLARVSDVEGSTEEDGTDSNKTIRTMALKNSNGQCFDFYSVDVMKRVFRVEKAGDFNIKAFDFSNGWLAYADCLATYVLHFDPATLTVKSKTEALRQCLADSAGHESFGNLLQNKIPPALHIQFFKAEEKDYLLLLTSSLVVIIVDIQDLKQVKYVDILQILEEHEKNNQQESKAKQKVRRYDKLFNVAKFDPSTYLFAINFFKHRSSLHVFDLKGERGSLHYSVPSEPLGSNVNSNSHKVNIPLQVHFSSDCDTFLVAYAHNNLITVHSLLQKTLHPWSTVNTVANMSHEFKNRYNRIVGVVERLPTKFVFYTHYTWFLLDIQQDLPALENQIGGSSKQGLKQQHFLAHAKQPKALDASSTWFTCLKESQRKYVQTMLRGQSIQRSIEMQSSGQLHSPDGPKLENLAIHKSTNPILHMQMASNSGEEGDSGSVPGDTLVISNQWKHSVQNFPGVAFMKNKFGL